MHNLEDTFKDLVVYILEKASDNPIDHNINLIKYENLSNTFPKIYKIYIESIEVEGFFTNNHKLSFDIFIKEDEEKTKYFRFQSQNKKLLNKFKYFQLNLELTKYHKKKITQDKELELIQSAINNAFNKQ